MTEEGKTERHEAWQLFDGLQMDLRAANAKLTALGSKLAGMNLPDPKIAICPKCGIRRPGPRSLAEHMYSSHDGDMPEHWESEA